MSSDVLSDIAVVTIIDIIIFVITLIIVSLESLVVNDGPWGDNR
jgi:hypothetical protein